MSDCVIDVAGLSKQYAMGAGGSATMGRLLRLVAEWPLRRLLGKPIPPLIKKREMFWPLRDVTFSVNRGEIVGVIGSNGAGKSTLLKILSRIISPTEGEAKISGKVSSLLEVGTGFSPNLSGRENIFLNAALHGLTKAEINSKLEEIIDFSGVRKFIDMPVKHYSSGMYSRLAFSVAAHLEPDVLFVDEVLSVGDLAFQRKCLTKFSELVGGHRTVLFVSHNLNAVSNICSKVLWLDEGRVRYFGPTEPGIGAYYQAMVPTRAHTLAARHDRTGTGDFRFSEINFYDHTLSPCVRVETGQELIIGLRYIASPANLGPIHDMNLAVVFKNDKGQRLFGLPSEVLPLNDPPPLETEGECLVRVKSLPLAPGIYDIDLGCIINRLTADKVVSVRRLVVTEADFFGSGRLPSPDMGDFVVSFEIDWR